MCLQKRNNAAGSGAPAPHSDDKAVHAYVEKPEKEANAAQGSAAAADNPNDIRVADSEGEHASGPDTGAINSPAVNDDTRSSPTITKLILTAEGNVTPCSSISPKAFAATIRRKFDLSGLKPRGRNEPPVKKGQPPPKPK